MERPHTFKSGVALQSNYSVHHRSDILLHEQIESVRKGQEDLKRALSNLETAKSQDNIDRCRNNVQEAKEKSEKGILVLQVLTKVNLELQFARAELDEALEKQEGDINEARKRVMWLEDRMGILCGKARLRGQASQKPKKSHRSPDRSEFRSRLGTASDSDSDDGGFALQPNRMGRNMSMEFSDTSRRAGVYSPSNSGSEAPPYIPPNRGRDDSSDDESYIAAQQQMSSRKHGRLEDSDSESDDGMPPPTMQGMPQISGPVVVHAPASASGMSETSEVSGSETGPQAVTSHLPAPQILSQRPDSGSSATEFQSEYSEAPLTSHMVAQAGEGYSVAQQEDADSQVETERSEVSGVDMVSRDVEDPQAVRGEDDQGETERDRDDESVDRERSEVSESARSSYSETSQPQSDPAFITEPPYAKERSVTIKTPKRAIRRGGRRVTFRDAVKEDTQVTVNQAGDILVIGEEMEEDYSRDYWLSEHHRFEYSEYSEVLLEIDPLSYHNVGIAVPGSFIEKPSQMRQDLPWRPRRKGSDINDVHKIALNKLSDRVHTMYGKFYDAALLSVRPLNYNENRREPSMFSSYDNNRDGARSRTPDSGPGMVTAPPTTADGMSRPQTVKQEIIPSKLRTGLNVYHPKPIPPPEMLPLTRTSKDKEYPRLSNQFCDADDILTHKPAVRIVDQRNLYKETKLKLYRDRPKKTEDGPSSMEKKFRMMLEQEKSMASRSTRSSRQTTPTSSRCSSGKTRGKGAGTRLSMLSRTLTKASTWSRLKPSSRGKEYSGLKWERVKTLVHMQLVSKRAEERRDAAKHLGLLRCGDAMVFFALKERLRVDEDSRTRYEAAKSLVLLGCWDEDVLQVILKYLVVGNSEIRQDLILNMIDGKNVQYVNKKIPTFPELVKVLSHFCRNPDPDDTIAFDAAVLLGKLCVMDENAKFKLLRSLDHSTDTHVKAKALETLVKQLNCTNWEIVQHLLSLFQESSVWRYRALAADLLIVLGKDHVCKRGEEERIYQILERKLWDDPNREVRVSAAKALTALGMFSKACDRIEKRLEDTDEDIRAQAVISVGTLEMKNEKIIRLLLEMLELDASEYVRLMIARTFTVLKLTDKRVLRALRERDKVDGALARESRRALKVLESLAALPRLTSPTGRKSMASRASARGATPRFTPAVIV